MSTKAKHVARSHRNYSADERVKASYFGSTIRTARTRELVKKSKEKGGVFSRIGNAVKRTFKREKKGDSKK